MSYSEDDPVGFRYPDKFLTCTQPVGGTSVGPGTDYPFAMTLEHAMNLYWKIYSFKVSGAYTFSWSYGPSPTILVTTVALVGGTISASPPAIWPPKMSEMVCTPPNPFFYGYSSVGSAFVNSSQTVGFTEDVLGELRILDYQPILRTEEEDDFQAKYYIPFNCSFGLGNDYGGGVTTATGPYSQQGPEITKPGLFKLKIGDTTYSTSLTGLETLFDAFGLALSGTIEMEAGDARLAE